jgi:hypothetical protein
MVAEDESGRIAASTLIPLVVARDVLSHDAMLLQRVDEASVPWRQRAAANHRAFVAARLAREESDAINRTVRRHQSSQPFQAGLFERRLQRAHDAVAAARAEADRDRADRLEAINRAGRISFLPPQLLLVLTP